MIFETADLLIRAILSEDGLGPPEPVVRPSLVNSRKKWSASLKSRKSSISTSQSLPQPPSIDVLKKVQTDRNKSGFTETPPVITPTAQNNQEPPSPDIQQAASQTTQKDKSGKKLR